MDKKIRQKDIDEVKRIYFHGKKNAGDYESLLKIINIYFPSYYKDNDFLMIGVCVARPDYLYHKLTGINLSDL